MGKGLVIGVIFGALLGAVAVRFLDGRRSRQAEESPARPGEPEARAKSGSEEVERLEKALTASRGENDNLQKKISELQSKASTPAAGPAVAAKGSRWKDVGLAFFKMKDKMQEPDAGNSPEAQQAFMELLAILGKIAKEYGVGMDELSGCPDAMPAMLLSILDAAGIQPDAAQQAAIDSAMNEGQAAWKDYLAKREDLTALERQRALVDLQGKTTQQLRGALSGPAEKVVDDLHMFDADFNFGGRSASYGGTRESVTQSLTGSWAKDLGLDDTQKISLGPVVDTYMREVDAAKADFARREAAGEKVSEREKSTASLEAMIRAQKRLGETMRLSEAQAKALKNWGTNYSYNLVDEAK
ncbi:MAG: hypothetical protein K8T20_13685 [Planctomycetes bacterium]|nr:hypothetical protein [Planctomycetota bacterium]